jgi:hypothetical protein
MKSKKKNPWWENAFGWCFRQNHAESTYR